MDTHVTMALQPSGPEWAMCPNGLWSTQSARMGYAVSNGCWARLGYGVRSVVIAPKLVLRTHDWGDAQNNSSC